jgi:hypothetical protein
MVGLRPVVAPRYQSGYLSPAEVRREIRHTDNWFVGPSVVYRRQPLAAIGYFDESLGTLCDGLAARLLSFRHGLYFAAEVLAVWTVNSTSFSAKSLRANPAWSDLRPAPESRRAPSAGVSGQHIGGRRLVFFRACRNEPLDRDRTGPRILTRRARAAPATGQALRQVGTAGCSAASGQPR